jgi:UDP-N-acetylglucosamine:LPS N-acetylglucosamine transferase
MNCYMVCCSRQCGHPIIAWGCFACPPQRQRETIDILPTAGNKMASPPRALQIPVVHLLYGTGGGGHLSSARAVRSALALLPAPPTVVLVDASALAGARFGDNLYNTLLSAGCPRLITLLHSATALVLPHASPMLTRRFNRFWAGSAQFRPYHDYPASARAPPPDVVVSFIPQLNAVFGDALHGSAPLVTVLTDFSHTSQHPWLQHNAQHVVCGTRKAYAQAAAILPRARRSLVSGMVVSPAFYAPAAEHRDALLSRLGLHVATGAGSQARQTVLLLFGADPPTGTVHELVRLFAERPAEDAVNVIVVCGRNKGLRQSLVDGMRRRQPGVYVTDASDDGARAVAKHSRRHGSRSAMHLHVTGLTDEIPGLMRAASVVIGKPGPGVVSEALVCGVPVVLVVGDGWSSVMQQERAVVEWVMEHKVGGVARSPKEAAGLVTREHVAGMGRGIEFVGRNRGVFEVAGIIAGEMENSTSASEISIGRQFSGPRERRHVLGELSRGARSMRGELVKRRRVLDACPVPTGLMFIVLVWMYLALRRPRRHAVRICGSQSRDCCGSEFKRLAPVPIQRS